MPRLALPLAAALAVLALAGCGRQNPRLIPQTRADALTATVDKIQSACAAGDRVTAEAAVVAANQQVSTLPRKVDSRLRANLRQWLNHIRDQLDTCKKPSESPTPTPSPSQTPSPSPSPTETPSATPTPTPTPSAAPSPTSTPSVSLPGVGGVVAPSDAQAKQG